MSVVTAYHIIVCVLFLVQGGMWTGYTRYLSLCWARQIQSTLTHTGVLIRP